MNLEKAAEQATLTLANLGNIVLWDLQQPHLYELVVTLFLGDAPLHNYRTRIGFRDARFELEGFFLNGKRTQIFGLNRHELYPYLGFSAPRRLLRRDAEILRRTFNCNSVRCSHYPQSEAFLDACDELGLMVWEETPGWQFIGDQSFQNLVLRDVEAMVRRDRNHPSIIIWGVRVNESRNDPALYSRTQEIAKSLDGSRPTSGTMTSSSRKDWQQQWHQDVFAFDDYHSAPDGSVGIDAPLPGFPYVISECVGQFNYGSGGFDKKYRRAVDPAVQMQQALFHAQAHSKAAAFPGCAGVFAWCAFDYASLMNAYDAVKCPGVADVFRTPKLGASFYLAQVDPALRPVIEPNFYWDFGPWTPSGPAEHAAIFSNCERLELFVDGRSRAVLHPDRAGFPYLQYPPFFADLKLDGSGKPELRIDGYVAGARVISRSFSSDRSSDRLWLHADDTELLADGADATRLAFAAVDKFGAPSPFVAGEVSLRIKGPGAITGDNPFQLGEGGGAGAVWIRTLPGKSGRIRVEASCASLGRGSVEIEVRNVPGT
jgi:beta-galactosidase